MEGDGQIVPAGQGVLENFGERIANSDSTVVDDAKSAGRCAITVVSERTNTSNTVSGAVIGTVVGIAGFGLAIWFGVTGAEMDAEEQVEAARRVQVTDEEN